MGGRGNLSPLCLSGKGDSIMPKTKRDYLKRTAGHAHVHLQRGAEFLIELEGTFRPVHPEHADYLTGLILALDEIMKGVDRFCDKAWGYHPDDYETWRNAEHITSKTGRSDGES